MRAAEVSGIRQVSKNRHRAAGGFKRQSGLVQHLMDEGDRDRVLCHGRGHALDLKGREAGRDAGI